MTARRRSIWRQLRITQISPKFSNGWGLSIRPNSNSPNQSTPSKRCCGKPPQYPEVNFYQGLSYFGLNEFEKAIDGFNKELEANPRYRRAHYYAALAFQSLGRTVDSIQQFEAILKENPNDTDVLYLLARLHKAASLSAVKRLDALDPDSQFIRVLKGEGHVDSEQYHEAIKEYKQILQKNPNFPGIHLALGHIYWKAVNNEEAEKELRVALNEDPNHPMASYYLGDILLRTQRSQQAIPFFLVAVKANPQFLGAYFQLGKCYAAEGNLQEALRVLLKALELNPDHKMTHYQLSQVYARLNDQEKKRHHLDIFRKLNDQERDKDFKSKQKHLYCEDTVEEKPTP